MEISIEHLNKNYGKQNVLKDISLHIPIGMYGMLGENGAGKTTLMRILATLSEPTTGMVEINGIDIKRKKEIRKIIGYLPQEFSIYPNMTVYSALDYLGILTELPNNIRKRRINELLKQVNLEHEKNKRFKNLSGGMKRRFGIAQALLNDPKILIIDEPTAGLDPEERLRFYNLLSELAVERIILLSTHIASDIEATCSKAAVLSSGTVVFEGQIGVFLFIPIIRQELEVSVKEIVYTKVWSYRKSVSIRLICSFWMITVMITIFASIMRLQNCSFPFLKYVTVTILYAVFLGILGLLFSQLGNNVIIGYLASLGYWSCCQFDILTEENVLYIFPIISGEIEMGKLMILMSINSFLLVVFFLSVKETRGMYK